MNNHNNKFKSMKKIVTLALLAIGLMAAAPVSAQVKFGLKGGLDVSDLHLKNLGENVDKKNRAGWFAGPTIKVTVPVVGLSFDAAVLYDYKSNKVEGTSAQSSGYSNPSLGSPGYGTTYTTSETTIKQQSIDIPINIRYGFGLGDAANIFLFAGPQWAFNVGDKDFNWETATTSSTYSLRSTNFSVNVGLGVTFLSHLQVSANYNIACGKTADLTVWDATRTGVRNTAKGRNNAWQIALAYYF